MLKNKSLTKYAIKNARDNCLAEFKNNFKISVDILIIAVMEVQ